MKGKDTKKRTTEAVLFYFQKSELNYLLITFAVAITLLSLLNLIM